MMASPEAAVGIDLNESRSFPAIIMRTFANFPLLSGSGCQIELSYQFDAEAILNAP